MARGELAHLARADDQHRFALEVAEDLAGQLDRGVAHRDGATRRSRSRADALGDAEGAGEDVVEQAVQRAELAPRRRRPSSGRGSAARPAPSNRGWRRRGKCGGSPLGRRAHKDRATDSAGSALPRLARNVADGGEGAGIGHGDCDLDAVAGGQDQRLVGAAVGAQLGDGVGEGGLGHGEPLAHFDRRGVVAEACEEQHHYLISSGRSPTCAAQVSPQNPTTTTARMAALRPRQPTATRK